MSSSREKGKFNPNPRPGKRKKPLEIILTEKVREQHKNNKFTQTPVYSLDPSHKAKRGKAPGHAVENKYQNMVNEQHEKKLQAIGTTLPNSMHAKRKAEDVLENPEATKQPRKDTSVPEPVIGPSVNGIYIPKPIKLFYDPSATYVPSLWASSKISAQGEVLAAEVLEVLEELEEGLIREDETSVLRR